MLTFPFKHIVIWIYLLIALAFVYSPPKTLKGFGEFIERHFGDSIAFYILHLGIVLVVLGSAFQWMSGVTQLGQSLVLAAMVALKLTRVAPNGTPTVPTGATITQEPQPK